MHVQIDCTIIY